MTRNRILTTRPGFTLTEVMIALAMTALLLIGISKIFALTSATISTGQAAAKAMRSQRAIQQTLSDDFLGTGPDIGNSSYSSGLIPLTNTIDPSYAMPYLSIASYRVPTYSNAASMAAAINAPPDFTGTLTASQYNARSSAIRTIDLNNNGVVDAAEAPISLYTYGDRNFRTDVLTFFTRGRFASESNLSVTQPQTSVTSDAAMVMYGHLRTYASDSSKLYVSAGFGCPGDWLTQTASPLPNRNNRFADQFRLGRFRFLLIEPTDQDGIPSSTNADSATTGLYDRNTVTNRGDSSQPLFFIERGYWDPNYINPAVTATAKRPTAISLLSSVSTYDVPTRSNVSVHTDDKTTSSVTTFWNAALGRTDILGTGVQTLRARIAVMQNEDAVLPPGSGAEWWNQGIPTSWSDRFWCNPFPALPISVAGITQQHMVLSDAASQFTVEYAGDFVKQAADGSLDTSTDDTLLPLAQRASRQGDGVLDFVVVTAAGVPVRQTRWYGMPRDVDGDGHIYATAPNNYQHSDVIPLRDIRGAASSFEKSYPAPVADYSTVNSEPTGTRGNGKTANGTPNDTAYLCVWGPTEFNSTYTPTASSQSYFGQVPQLIRILVDVRDPDGKMKEPLTQEYVFPVRVTGAVKPPTASN